MGVSSEEWKNTHPHPYNSSISETDYAKRRREMAYELLPQEMVAAGFMECNNIFYNHLGPWDEFQNLYSARVSYNKETNDYFMRLFPQGIYSLEDIPPREVIKL